MSRLYSRVVSIALSSLIWSSIVLAGSPVGGHLTQDWAQVAAAAQAQNIPIMVIFSGAQCAYCERLKEQLLHPMYLRGDFTNRALVREFDIKRHGKIIDFDGESVRARIFVNRYEVFATPTVIMLDAEGRPLVAPLVGYNGQEDYLPLLENAIAASYTLLQGPDRDTGLASVR